MRNNVKPRLQNVFGGQTCYLSRVGCHGLDDLLLAILLRVVLKVGLRVRGRYQRGPSS